MYDAYGGPLTFRYVGIAILALAFVNEYIEFIYNWEANIKVR